jgi:hypothetical protein
MPKVARPPDPDRTHWQETFSSWAKASVRRDALVRERPQSSVLIVHQGDSIVLNVEPNCKRKGWASR